jgi:hypothetical protein
MLQKLKQQMNERTVLRRQHFNVRGKQNELQEQRSVD